MPEVKKIEKEGELLIVEAREAAITTQEEEAVAGEAVVRIAEFKARVNKLWEPMITTAKQNLATIKSQLAVLVKPANEADTLYRGKISDYRDMLKAERLKEERERQAAARKKAEEDRDAAAALAEIRGDNDQAERIQAAPVHVPKVSTPVVQAPKTKGITTREDWKFEIENPNLIPREFLKPDEVAIGAHVRSKKEQANIPGVRAYPKTTTVVTKERRA